MLAQRPRQNRPASARFTRTRGFLLAATLVLAGCQTPKPNLSEQQIRVRTELQAVDPRSDRLASSTPIVDIHTHTFNARYLPLEGILLGKRDAAPPVSWLLSDPCAIRLAQALIDRTELAPAEGMPAVEPKMHGRMPYSTAGVDPLCRVFLKLLNTAVERGAWDADLPIRRRMSIVEDIAEGMNLQERMAVRTAIRMMGMEQRTNTTDSASGLQAAVRFLWMLTQNDAEMTQLFRDEYAGLPMRGNPLMISHMMDLAPVYDQKPDGVTLLRFQLQQVRRMEAYQDRPDSGLIYFVAYNPYRDYWMNEQSGDALRIVRSAIKDHGAWGVKVYPPSGYRPAGNEIPRRASSPLTPFPGRQWDARYSRLEEPRNRALDRRLEELLVWCIQEDVPVFVHCGTGEFEARKGYGAYHSDPRFWREFLESHPEPDGSPCRLRLCLGHAGGGGFWFGETEYADWGKEVYDLCREFPDVYCEITTHGELADPDTQAYFVEHLAALFAEPGGRTVAGHKYPYRFRLDKKLLYGTDWYLPEATDRRLVLLGTQKAFLHKKLRQHYRDYFSGNALRFLNARERLRDTTRPVSPAVRTRLRTVIAQTLSD